ncbi:hypothetical protein [Paraburkholderia sp. J94]|uniref:hypothetical protein n=1 Tax=Paraburkholderia sp. J94 TaxID=2805441 RepID=UPI002AB11D63|nr:hypothetical protein [Paraburkholderia sp. J94]
MNKLPRKANPFVLIDCTATRQESVAQEHNRESKSAVQVPVFEDEVGYIGESPALHRALKDEVH